MNKLEISLAICVFGGSKSGRGGAMSDAARQVGELIGKNGHHLVYGAGGSGLMAELAWSAMRNGASVTGYAPRFIRDRELTMALPQQTLHVTEDIFDRKRRMIEHGDAFIALPGGYGTLDEILDVLSLTYLNVHNKPLILLNTSDFWNDLIGLAAKLHEAGFADQDPGSLLLIAESPAEAIALAEYSSVPTGEPGHAADLPAPVS